MATQRINRRRRIRKPVRARPVELDALRSPLPCWLADVFAGRRELMWWCKQLDKLEEELAAMDGLLCVKHLDVPELRRTLRRTRETIARNVPYVRCKEPNCGPLCPRCDGDRWTTATTAATPMPPTPG